MSSKMLVLFCLVQILIPIQSAPSYPYTSPGSHSVFGDRDSDNRVISAYANRGNAGASLADWNSEHTNGALLYGDAGVDSSSEGVNMRVGLGRHHTGLKQFAFSGDMLAGGIEGSVSKKNLGLMSRASLVQSTMHVGPVGINVGKTYDTGVKFDRGAEIKFLGNGGRVNEDGFEICFIGCFGVNWG